jgi:hypothetical protein
MILAGDKIKTTTYTFVVWWPSEGTNRDGALGGQVNTWIAQNERVLNKQRADKAVKLLAEQFPWLKQIDAQHVQLQWARAIA